MKNHIRRLLESRWCPLVLAMVAMLLVAGTLGTGIQFDDYIHHIKFEEPELWPGDSNSIVGMFDFVENNPKQLHEAMEVGMVPWWTSKALKVSFFRPVTALTHWVDYHLWPDNYAMMHLQSVLWFGAFVLMAALVYRRFMTPCWVAGLAALLFAIDDAHGVPVGWLANRNSLVAAVFGFLALLCHDRWRRHGHRGGVVYAPLVFLVGLLSAEAGLGAGAYLLSYEVFMVKDKLQKRVMALLPYAAVFAGWYIIFKISGFGTSGSGAYIDPGQQPLAYLNVLWERLPVPLYGQWFFPNSLVYGMLPKPFAYGVLAVIYAILTALVLVLPHSQAGCRIQVLGAGDGVGLVAGVRHGAGQPAVDILRIRRHGIVGASAGRLV
jgi:hypothetical protein